jgi:hypothetical protein
MKQAHSSQEATRDKTTGKPELEEEKKKNQFARNLQSFVFERRQEAAVKISNEHFPLFSDPSKKHVFVAKCIDTHVMIDKVVRAHTALEFHDGCWHSTTALAKRSEMDDRE